MAEKDVGPQTGWVPVPDPTQRTAEQLAIAISGLRELVEARLDASDRAMELHRSAEQRDISAVRELLETRLAGGDKAIELVRVESERLADLIQLLDEKIPGVMDEKIAALRTVHDEKFRGIQTQFNERDTAVRAAFDAAKEAVGEQNKSNLLSIAKSEAATDKRIDQQGVQIQTSATATDDKIGDIKERLTRIEGMGQGKSQQLTTALAVAALGLATLGFFVGRMF